MRKITLIAIACIFSFALKAGIIYVPSTVNSNSKQVEITSTEVLSQLDAKAFLALTPGQVKNLLEKK